ncbi:hypothetical protein IK146_00385 [Candidatus Saccharibacteria bacterium]|nr:hypothetical protein [Candidatus Saccharibacteria bacterium]
MRAKIDFDSWEKNGARDSVHKILIAPSDVIVNSIFALGERNFFSYRQALKVEREFLIPNGWRLPTISELFGISERIVRKIDPSDKTGVDLELCLDGYHRCPEIDHVDFRKLFWSSDKNPKRNIVHAFALYDKMFDDYGSESFGHAPADASRDTALRARIIAVKDL